MPKKIFDDDDPNYIEQWLDRRINRMSSEEREIFFSLADSRCPFFSISGAEQPKIVQPE
jgi:hypothetical protein